MSDRSRLAEAAPHYLAVVLLLLGSLAVTRATVGDVGFIIEVGIAVAVGTAYFIAVQWLGIAPSMWEPE